MALATTPMAKHIPEEQDSESAEYCTYTSLKVDDRVMPEIKAAAAFAEVSVQELVSDILNEWAAKRFKHPIAKRRKPPPRKPKS